MNKIALGTAQFGTNYGINSSVGKVTSDAVNDILYYARSQNIGLLDTAPVYGDSEKVLGLANIQDFLITTKTRHFDRAVITDKEIDILIGDFNLSLKLLKQASVYSLLVHNADDLLKPGADRIINQFQILKQQGLVSKIGVSIYTGEQLQKIIDRFDIDIVQLPLNIIDSRLIVSGILHKLYNNGIEVHARSVFLQGLLLKEKYSRPNKFNRWDSLWKLWQEWLTDNKLTALEATIRYAISLPEISQVLVGVDSKDQLEDIIKATDGQIPSIPEELFVHDLDLLNPSNWDNL